MASPWNVLLGATGFFGSAKSQKLGMRVPSISACGFCSQAGIQSGRSRSLARRKLGAAEPGSCPGRISPTTWQLVHFNSSKSACASRRRSGEGGSVLAVK